MKEREQPKNTSEELEKYYTEVPVGNEATYYANREGKLLPVLPFIQDVVFRG